VASSISEPEGRRNRVCRYVFKSRHRALAPRTRLARVPRRVDVALSKPPRPPTQAPEPAPADPSARLRPGWYDRQRRSRGKRASASSSARRRLALSTPRAGRKGRFLRVRQHGRLIVRGGAPRRDAPAFLGWRQLPSARPMIMEVPCDKQPLARRTPAICYEGCTARTRGLLDEPRTGSRGCSSSCRCIVATSLLRPKLGVQPGGPARCLICSAPTRHANGNDSTGSGIAPRMPWARFSGNHR